MTKSKKFTYLEKWSDGTERVVIRQSGKFVDNTNLTSLRKASTVSSR